MRKILFSIALVLALVSTSVARAQTPPFTRTVIVNSTGVPTTDGTALLSALSSLSPTPSSTNVWQIQLEGGVYDVGTTAVVLQPYVNLAGAGDTATIVRGSVGPSGSILGGLVQGASNSQIRDLTIQCLSDSIVASCQALSLENADARLDDIIIVSGGTGTGAHWGIRTFESQPTLDQVQISLTSTTADYNYGIVYGGSSQMNIKRSSILVQGAVIDNWGILIKEDLLYSVMSDSSIVAKNGNEAAGVYFLQSTATNHVGFDNVLIDVSSASSRSVGIGAHSTDSSAPRIYFRHGRIKGSSHGVDHPRANIDLVNTEVFGSTVRVSADRVKAGGSWLRGAGTISGTTSLVCAGNFDAGYTFYPSTCPP